MDVKDKSISENDSLRPWQSYHTAYTNAKAGMEGVDKEKVQRIVYEMSKGSKYFENEERKEAYMKQKIENMRARSSRLTSKDLAYYQKIADKRIVELEATRDLSRIWLHVDMDAFYAAVETLCNPSLEGKPMAVGSMSMISTANYEARKFGVRAAMPGFIARKLCPELIFVPVDFKKYTHYSDLTRKVFQKYDPNFLAASLDEAYLDITEVCKARGISGEEVAEEIRASVNMETGLTCSAGVAPNRLLAKVCSDINKPNGQFVLPNDRMAVMTFISSLPIRKIGGIGKVTENVLKDVFEVSTCEEMLQKSSFLVALFSRSSADFFLSVGLGLGRTDIPIVKSRKSISNERTFSATEDEASLYQKLVDLAEVLAADMKREGLCGRSLTLKLKTASFEVRSRAVTLPDYISSSEDILKHASKLLKAELPASLRLMGLRMSHFDEGKNGASPDLKQKTLSNFMIPGGGSRDWKLADRDLNDDALSNDTETSFSTGMVETCHFGDLVNHNQFSDLNPSMPGQSDETKCVDPQRDDFKDSIDNCNMEGKGGNSFKEATSQLGGDDVSREEFVESSLDGHKNRIKYVENETVASSNQKELLLWLDDYKCSLCGVELPPIFVEERQEHFDFHLAEKLQEEESSNVCKKFKPNQRLTQKDHFTSHTRQKKKQKASPSQSKYVPIDMFFTKTNQNF